MSAARVKKFKVYLVANEEFKKVWQELRENNAVMRYTAIFEGNSGFWDLYSKLGTLRGETEYGDFIRGFSSPESLYLFLGVDNPPIPSRVS